MDFQKNLEREQKGLNSKNCVKTFFMREVQNNNSEIDFKPHDIPSSSRIGFLNSNPINPFNELFGEAEERQRGFEPDSNVKQVGFSRRLFPLFNKRDSSSCSFKTLDGLEYENEGASFYDGVHTGRPVLWEARQFGLVNSRDNRTSSLRIGRKPKRQRSKIPRNLHDKKSKTDSVSDTGKIERNVRGLGSLRRLFSPSDNSSYGTLLDTYGTFGVCPSSNALTGSRVSLPQKELE